MDQLTALLLSIAIELPVAALALYALEKRADRTVALVAIAATLVTHPLAWFLNTVALVEVMSFAVRAAIIEISVSAMEAFIYARALQIGSFRALLVSALANACSFGTGLLLWYVGWSG